MSRRGHVATRGRVLTRESEVGDDVVAAWDELAVAARRPLAAPAWLMAWWRAMAPPGAELRIVVVEDGGRVIGLAPLMVVRRRRLAWYLPLGGPDMGIRNTPLAEPGRELDVARELAATLASCSPRPAAVVLDQVDVASPWPMLLRRVWPGLVPPRLERGSRRPAPTLHLAAASYEEWLSSKSSNFRQRLRRDGRKLAERGAVTARAATPDELRAALRDFQRLHGERWGDETPLADEAGHRMMLEAGLELLADDRFRAWTIAIGDRPVTVQVFVAAGGEVVYWNGGWDPEFASLSPAMVGICAGVEDAFGRGEARIDFGEGDHHYKTRLADHAEDVESVTLYPRGVRYPATLLGTAPRRLRGAARAVLDRLPGTLRERAVSLTTRRRRDGDGGGASG